VFYASPRAHGNSFDGAGTTKFWGQGVLLSSLEYMSSLFGIAVASSDIIVI